MTEGVVPRPAEVFAAGAVIVRGARHAVRQTEVRTSGPSPLLLLLHPGTSDVRYTLFRHARYQRVWNNN